MRYIYRLSVSLIMISCIIATIGCTDNEKVYKKGFDDGVRYVFQNASKLKEDARNKMASQLLFYSFVICLFTAIGDKIAEIARIKFGDLLRLNKQTQEILAKLIYLLTSTVFIWYAVANYSHQIGVPVSILIAGSFYFFWFCYVPALRAEDKMKCRYYLSKVKIFYFAALTYIVLYQALTDAGFAGVKLSVGN